MKSQTKIFYRYQYTDNQYFKIIQNLSFIHYINLTESILC